ncbi:MAG: hypothetical protein M0C28_48020 [Candidatus Moduliflexus flocculans]|nr:hypothetical protein [Candidatus Moduliflexus flocculans]
MAVKVQGQVRQGPRVDQGHGRPREPLGRAGPDGRDPRRPRSHRRAGAADLPRRQLRHAAPEGDAPDLRALHHRGPARRDARGEDPGLERPASGKMNFIARSRAVPLSASARDIASSSPAPGNQFGRFPPLRGSPSTTGIFEATSIAASRGMLDANAVHYSACCRLQRRPGAGPRSRPGLHPGPGGDRPRRHFRPAAGARLHGRFLRRWRRDDPPGPGR